MSRRLLDGRYQLDRLIGRGGTAAVWQGVDTRLGRPVAVKILDGARLGDLTAARRFDREARTVARLSHPNIVAVYDAGRDGGVAYLVMELVDGDSLAAVLADGPLDIGPALAIATQLCDALAAAHDEGVVHRDIKPANILVNPTGTVKVCDFGIARLLHASANQASLTGPAIAVGTSDYMAPEQVTGDPVDARTDLYALGCVLYAMLTGAPPFTGDSPVGIASQHLHRPPPAVRSRRGDVPAELDALVGDLLAKNPTHRPVSTGHVRARLTAMSDHPADAAAKPHPVAEARSGRWPNGRAAVIAPTRRLPSADPGTSHGRPAPATGRFRFGPIGAAVTAVVAALAAIIVTTLLISEPPRRQAEPPVTPTAPTAAATSSGAITTTPPPTAAGPAQLVAAVQAGIQQQAQAGQLDPAVAEELTRKLDEINRDLTKGKTDKAAGKVADIRAELTELRNDNKLTAAARQALSPLLDRLAAALPPARKSD